MPMQQPNSKIQVRLTVCDNEPLARLAEQRLQQEHIACVVSSLGPGPGGWGVATFLPHAIYVKATDEMHARQVLGVTPAEIEEREPTPAPSASPAFHTRCGCADICCRRTFTGHHRTGSRVYYQIISVLVHHQHRSIRPYDQGKPARLALPKTHIAGGWIW